MRKMISAAALVVFAACLPVLAAANVETGAEAPDFTLPDTLGRQHALSEQKGKYVVLEWTNPECPFVQKHYMSGNMQSLQKEFTEQGVVWYSVASSAPGKQGYYSASEWNDILRENGSHATALLLDPEGEAGRAYGAKTTPHMYLIDPEGALIYQGAIDSMPTVDPDDIPESTNYLRQAFQEAGAGQPVSTPSTRAYGCSVKY